MKQATRHIKAFQGEVPQLFNADTAWGLRVSRDDVRKIGRNADQTDDELRAVAGIEALARRAVVGDRHPDTQHQNPDVRGILRLYAPLQIGDTLYRVRLTVKDYENGQHNLHALEIENALPGISPSYSGADEALQTGQPTTGRNLSIDELLRGAVRHSDGEPFEPET